MTVIDLPAWVPMGPDGRVNLDQLEREWNWRRNTWGHSFAEYAAHIDFAAFFQHGV